MRNEAAGPSAVSCWPGAYALDAGRLPTDGLGEIRTAFDWRNFAHRVDVNKRNAIPRARCRLIDYQFHRVAGLLRLAF